MKSKFLKLKLNPAIFCLILSCALFLISCDENVQLFELKAGFEETQEYKIITLMQDAISCSSSAAVKSLTNEANEQCIVFQYPIIFYSQIPGASTIDLITINIDQDLIDYFDERGGLEELRIGYPLVLLDDEENQTIVYNNEEFENTLQAAVNVCRGVRDFE